MYAAHGLQPREHPVLIADPGWDADQKQLLEDILFKVRLKSSNNLAI